MINNDLVILSTANNQYRAVRRDSITDVEIIQTQRPGKAAGVRVRTSEGVDVIWYTDTQIAANEYFLNLFKEVNENY